MLAGWEDERQSNQSCVSRVQFSTSGDLKPSTHTHQLNPPRGLLLHSFTIRTDVLSDEPSAHESVNATAGWSKHIEQAIYYREQLSQTGAFPYQLIPKEGKWTSSIVFSSTVSSSLHTIICFGRRTLFLSEAATFFLTMSLVTCTEHKMCRRNKTFLCWQCVSVCAHLPLGDKNGI